MSELSSISFFSGLVDAVEKFFQKEEAPSEALTLDQIKDPECAAFAERSGHVRQMSGDPASQRYFFEDYTKCLSHKPRSAKLETQINEKVPPGLVRIVKQFPGDPKDRTDPTLELYQDVGLLDFIKDPNNNYSHFGNEETRKKLVFEGQDRKVYQVVLPEEIILSEIEIKTK